MQTLIIMINASVCFPVLEVGEVEEWERWALLGL